MTYKQKLKENTMLIALFDSYLMKIEHSFDDRLKLTTEIGRLNTQNQEILNQKISEFNNDINDYTIDVNSEVI